MRLPYQTEKKLFNSILAKIFPILKEKSFYRFYRALKYSIDLFIFSFISWNRIFCVTLLEIISWSWN